MKIKNINQKKAIHVHTITSIINHDTRVFVYRKDDILRL